LIDVVQLFKALDEILREERRKNCMADMVIVHGRTYIKLLNMAKERINIPRQIRIPPAMTMAIGQKKVELNHRMPMIVTQEVSKNRKPGR
jgi:hypothetical protein